MKNIFILILLTGLLVHWILGFYVFRKKTGIEPKVKNPPAANWFLSNSITRLFGLAAMFSLLAILAPDFILKLSKLNKLDIFMINLSGFIIGAAGIGIMIKGQFDIKTSWRIGFSSKEKNKLITAGIYKQCRHPMYFGMTLVLLGFFLIFPHWATLSIFLLICFVVNVQARLEEDYLLKQHGRHYAKYMKKVPRFF